MSNNGIDSDGPEALPTILYVGHHESVRASAVTQELLDKAQTCGYDLVTAPLTNDAFQSRVLRQLEDYVAKLRSSSKPVDVPLPLIAALTPDDTDRRPSDMNPSILGVVSPWIDLGSSDPLIAAISRQVFNLEIAYAAFCGVNNLLIHGPVPGSNAVQYSRAIVESLGLGPYLHLHILLPMTGELEEAEAFDTHLSELARPQYLAELDGQDEDVSDSDTLGCWETWNTIRTMCDYSMKLSVALELPRQITNIELQSRWHSEPVRAILIPRTSFLRNEKGHPVLSKSNQQLLSRLMRLRYVPFILLGNVDPISGFDVDQKSQTLEPTPAEAAASPQQRPFDSLSHLRYLRYLQQNQLPRPPMERFGQGYQDYMQSPLQPLTDNLESITYEVFEKDPVKYEWYERAVASALKDLCKLSDSEKKPVVAVVGAGRGPLVTRVLSASKSTGIEVHCCAVEKNPNAHVVIQRKNKTDPLWNNQVMIFKSDMRTWPGPTIDGQLRKVDILVSELLGSFADNELSPECLDGVQHVLHPEHGINIPQSYSAHLTPIASPKLYADILHRGDGSDRWELPYVVMLHQYDFLSVEGSTEVTSPIPSVKEAWSFSHPISDKIIQQAQLRAGGTVDGGGWTGGDGKNEHNIRSCRASFQTRKRGVCHGLGGYFETVLYSGSDGPIELSTNPVTMENKSKDMISWFPIFFPLKTPLLVPDDAVIEVTMWRQTDDRKVWYEWVVEVFKQIGRTKVKLGMSEMHSSRKNGCLM